MGATLRHLGAEADWSSAGVRPDRDWKGVQPRSHNLETDADPRNGGDSVLKIGAAGRRVTPAEVTLV